jgi:hypothetical protein
MAFLLKEYQGDIDRSLKSGQGVKINSDIHGLKILMSELTIPDQYLEEWNLAVFFDTDTDEFELIKNSDMRRRWKQNNWNGVCKYSV